MLNSVNSIFFPFPSVILVAPLQSIWFNRHNAELSRDTMSEAGNSTLRFIHGHSSGASLLQTNPMFEHFVRSLPDNARQRSRQCDGVIRSSSRLHIVQHTTAHYAVRSAHYAAQHKCTLCSTTAHCAEHNCTLCSILRLIQQRPNCQCCSPLPLPLGEKLPISMTFWD